MTENTPAEIELMHRAPENSELVVYKYLGEVGEGHMLIEELDPKLSSVRLGLREID